MESKTVIDLKNLLRSQNLKVSGRKEELIDRILEHNAHQKSSGSQRPVSPRHTASSPRHVSPARHDSPPRVHSGSPEARIGGIISEDDPGAYDQFFTRVGENTPVPEILNQLQWNAQKRSPFHLTKSPDKKVPPTPEEMRELDAALPDRVIYISTEAPTKLKTEAGTITFQIEALKSHHLTWHTILKLVFEFYKGKRVAHPFYEGVFRGGSYNGAPLYVIRWGS